MKISPKRMPGPNPGENDDYDDHDHDDNNTTDDQNVTKNIKKDAWTKSW